MTTSTAFAALLGAILGLGLWSLVSVLPRLGRPSLSVRIAPHLLDVSAGARELAARRSIEPVPILGSIFGTGVGQLRTRMVRLPGGTDSTVRRLAQSGSTLTVEGYRSQILISAGLGVVGGGIIGAAIINSGGSTLLAGVVAVIGGALGVAMRERMLTRAVQRRVQSIEAELPTVLEFLSLSLSAGEGILDAIRRIGIVSHGELAVELTRVSTDTSTGVPLARALDELAERISLPALSRCVSQLVAALERGNPLVAVFRAQAQDAREEARRRLIESAGKKEVAMMVPLVFLILPVTVAFAVFPGILMLRSGF